MLKQYDDNTLKKLHDTHIQLLNELKRICEKHNIKYFAAFGTLLGAVRHNGFIPWDDDLDVGMIREDYEKFVAISKKECSDKFFIQTKDTDKNYHLPFGKLRMNNTKFVEHHLKNNDIHHGIYIDIFPFDGIPEDKKKLKKLIRKATIWSTLYNARFVKGFEITALYPLMNFILKLMWFLAHYGMKIIHLSPDYISRKVDKYTKEANIPDSKSVAYVCRETELSITPREYLKDLTEVPFENTTIMIPKEYDIILTNKFGDYMVLPPEEKRVNHCPDIVEFE